LRKPRPVWLSLARRLTRLDSEDRPTMKVRELLQNLGTLDPELEVLCLSEDANLAAKGQQFRLLDIESISALYAEMVRLDDDTPYLKLGEGPSAVAFAILQVTMAF